MIDGEVHAKSFAEFTAEVAEKFSQGLDVTIVISPLPHGGYTAVVGLPLAGAEL